MEPGPRKRQAQVTALLILVGEDQAPKAKLILNYKYKVAVNLT